MIISPSAISPYKIPTFQSGGEVPFSFGNALKFDGVNDYTSSSLTKAELGTSFTIGSWLKLDSSVAVPSCIYNVSISPTHPSPFIFVQTTSSGIRFYVNQNFRMSITINRDEWYYIALNYESSNWSVFVNGVSASTYAGGLGTFTASNLYIGGNLTGNSKITIDEFSVWTQELTPTQNLNQYNSGLGNFANLDIEPLLWYNCNEADGSTTLVNSGSGGASYNGTLNNFSTPPAYFIPHVEVPFSFGNALEFDGANDYVSFDSINHGLTFTFSFWFKPETFTGTIFGNSVDANYIVRLVNNTTFRYAAGGVSRNFTIPPLSTGVWYHGMLSSNGTGSNLRFYLNGVESTTGALVTATGATNQLGKYYTGTLAQYDGVLDEVAISVGYAGSLANAAALYNSGNGAFAKDILSNVVAYWRMNGVSDDSTAIDEQGTYNGALNNFNTATCWVAH